MRLAQSYHAFGGSAPAKESKGGGSGQTPPALNR